MNSFLIILSCVAAASFANPAQEIVVEYRNGVAQCRINCNRNRSLPTWLPTWGDCPPVNCGPVVRDGICGAPDCSIPGNRHVLHPHPDPNYFWQCGPSDAITWGAHQRKCGCGSLFSYLVDPTRCVHPHEWIPDCPNQPDFPTLNPDHCGTECPDCDGNGNGPNTPPPTVEPIPPTLPPNGNCPCPCVPCVWWPCLPCVPTAMNCPCNGPPQQRPTQPQIPQNPWNQQPNNPQTPWNQQPNNPQRPIIQIPTIPQLPWNQQPNNPWNQQPNDPWNQPRNPVSPWDQQPIIPTNPWDQQPNNPQRPWDSRSPQQQPTWW